MERHDFVNGVRRSWAFLSAVGLAESFATPDPLIVDAGFRTLALSGNVTHAELYHYCLERSLYNILLFDHSFFQFGWDGGGSLRYAFYPNPYVSQAEALHKFRRYRQMVRNNAIDEEEFSQLVSTMHSAGGVPIFRYEYSAGQRVSLAHPASHMHIGVHSQNRWAFSRVLTPPAFTMLMVKSYFPGEWLLGEEGVVNGEINIHERSLIDEKANCRMMGDDLFDDNERQSFSFG